MEHTSTADEHSVSRKGLPDCTPDSSRSVCGAGGKRVAVLGVAYPSEAAHSTDPHVDVRVRERCFQTAARFRRRHVAQGLAGPSTNERLATLKGVQQHRHRGRYHVDQAARRMVALAPVPGMQVPAKYVHGRLRAQYHDSGQRGRPHRPAEDFALEEPGRYVDYPPGERSRLAFCLSNGLLQYGQGRFTVIHQRDQRFPARVLSRT